MFNPLRKTFESDNEGPNKKNNINDNNKEKSSFINNKTKGNKFKVPKNFGKKKFKYTIDEESDTNMILEQEYENNNKIEKSTTNNINLRLLSHDSILWKKAAIFLLQIKIKNNDNKKYNKEIKNEIIEEDEPKIKNKTLEYLCKLTNSTKEFWKICEISDEKEIKKIIIDYIKQYTYKIKLLIIYLDKNVNNKENKEFGEKNKNKIFEKSEKINENSNDNIIKCINNEDLNDSGFRNDLFIDLFSCNEINIPFYIITNKHLYAKLFNKKNELYFYE